MLLLLLLGDRLFNLDLLSLLSLLLVEVFISNGGL